MLIRTACRLLKSSGSFLRFQMPRHFAKLEDNLPDDRDTRSQTTQVNMLSIEDDGCLYIHEYSDAGFTLRSGVKIFGPTVFFPRSFFSWKIKSTEDINDKSLSMFTMVHPKLDLLIIGKGDSSEEVNPGVIKYLRMNKINFEILTSEQAMSTFNFLNKEHRWVAAAIIPPQYIYTLTQEDIQQYFATKKQEASLIIDSEDTEQIESDSKLIERNLFGYEIIKAPLESNVTDVIEANRNLAASQRKTRKGDGTKKVSRKDDDPWADDDEDITDKTTDKSTDKSTGKSTGKPTKKQDN